MEPDRPAAARPQPMGFELPGLGRDAAAVRQRIEAMERLLERSLTIPGTRVPIGLDAIAGLIPVVGDLLAAALGAWLVWEAKNLGLPKWQLWRMAANVGIDTAIGAVPVIGDVFDFAFRSNSKNLRIVKRHLDKHHPATRVLDG